MTDTETGTSTPRRPAPESADSDREHRAEMAASGMILAHWARVKGDKPAIIAPSGDRTFAELNANANRLARALRRRGLADGDAVGLICGNRAEFAEAIAAAQRAGLRLTPINWHLTGDEAAYILDDCEAKALIADASLADVAVGAAAAAPRCSVRLAVGGPIEGFEDYDGALAAEGGSDLTDPVLGRTMLYTSGTTGRPKGVNRPPVARGATPSATGTTGRYRWDADELHLCTGPLYHAAPLAISLSTPLLFGVGVVLMERWDAEEALRLIDRHRITHTHMVPTMFHRLLSLPDDVKAKYDVSSLRYVVHGAAPCPVAVKRGLIEWLGPVVYEYYAATEGGGTFVDSETWMAH
ncbi:MAG TPA: AMP-binding protein, partial [Acidimicrobiales bacterium]|nr:AMP-binding protein [Acidimicrobiales bacterium]